MSLFPCYQYHIGSKQEVFTGVKIYLKKCKDVYEVKNNECDKLFDDMDLANKKLLKSFNDDIEVITSLQKEYDTKHSEWIKLFTLLKSNETKFFLDLINLFLD